jgi:hypothetical protein
MGKLHRALVSVEPVFLTASYEVEIIEPPLLLRIGSTGYLIPQKTSRNRTAMVLSKSSAGIDSIGPIAPANPVLLNMISSRSYSRSAQSTAALMSGSLRRCAERPPLRSSDLSDHALPALRVQIRSEPPLNPPWLKHKAVPRPIPLATPVMTATLPSSLPISLSSFGEFAEQQAD